MNRIKELRLEKNLTQKQVSEATNIPQNTLSNYENENREPSIFVWQALANYFNVSVGYIQGATDMRTIPLLDELGGDRDISPEFMQLINQGHVESVELFEILFNTIMKSVVDKIPKTLTFDDKRKIAVQIEDLFYKEVGEALAKEWGTYESVGKILNDYESKKLRNWISENDDYLYNPRYGKSEIEMSFDELQEIDTSEHELWIKVYGWFNIDGERHNTVGEAFFGDIILNNGSRLLTFKNSVLPSMNEEDVIKIVRFDD